MLHWANNEQKGNRHFKDDEYLRSIFTSKECGVNVFMETLGFTFKAFKEMGYISTLENVSQSEWLETHGNVKYIAFENNFGEGKFVKGIIRKYDLYFQVYSYLEDITVFADMGTKVGDTTYVSPYTFEILSDMCKNSSERDSKYFNDEYCDNNFIDFDEAIPKMLKTYKDSAVHYMGYYLTDFKKKPWFEVKVGSTESFVYSADIYLNHLSLLTEINQFTYFKHVLPQLLKGKKTDGYKIEGNNISFEITTVDDDFNDCIFQNVEFYSNAVIVNPRGYYANDITKYVKHIINE